MERGSPTPRRSRTPPGAPLAWPHLLPLAPLYTGAGGTPYTQQLISDLLAMCGAPSTIILDNIVAVLRQSPATVEHQDRHHAVMLTELFPDTLLDQSPRIVIELNVC